MAAGQVAQNTLQTLSRPLITKGFLEDSIASTQFFTTLSNNQGTNADSRNLTSNNTQDDMRLYQMQKKEMLLMHNQRGKDPSLNSFCGIKPSEDILSESASDAAAFLWHQR